MLDLFTILTKGGIVLWSKTFARFASSPVDALIKDVLIEERAGANNYTKDSFNVKWTFANELDLIFVVAYQKILQLAYIDELLATVKKFFCDKFAQIIRDTGKLHLFPFDDDFDMILRNFEEKGFEEKRSKPRKFEETKKYKATVEGSKKLEAKDIVQQSNVPAIDEEEIARKVEALRAKGGAGGKSARMRGSRGKSSPTTEDNETKSTKKKVMRKWNGQLTKEQEKSLNYSNEQDDAGTLPVAQTLVNQSQMGQRNRDGNYEVQDLGENEDMDCEDEEDETNGLSHKENKSKESGNGMFSFFKSITGQKELSEKDLEPVLANMREHLIKKNVASDIASHLCDSVAKNLVGQKLGSFKSVQSTVKQSMEIALKRILTPKTSVDLLRDIEQAQAESRPYTICFIGVNGVALTVVLKSGKSTNLSKTCFWLLQNGLKVLIAACDTFRSGAVEQLRVHVRNLNALGQNSSVELYERGYGKDAAGIAKDAVNYAKANKFDVVLIDTAGRMQDNEPLMRALSKLVSVNNPDKIIFVGEALVGNEAVDQLTKFNQALRDFSGLQNPRHIDGIILTKFDTIDDKVGAALSMAYITGQPILFVGTGQTYTDLKNMRVAHVVNSLLKD
ncbi:1285_t:CDS:10 [Ambispora gerdemannii]|uniref:1285_t:CDS:1 n=1 Tax=Ambispora gerdemannii TaxID=144530 RepID=A0A9N9BE07_9GLOM|nr:1285_t:CDS:10 [Ambispora gerdemannii]